MQRQFYVMQRPQMVEVLHILSTLKEEYVGAIIFVQVLSPPLAWHLWIVHITKDVIVMSSLGVSGSIPCAQDYINEQLLQVVLATGLGNLTDIRIQTARMGQFGSRPIQNPVPQLLGRPSLDPHLLTRGFCWLRLDPSVPISDSGQWVFYLWSHSGILLLIAKYWGWYVIVYFGRISCLNNQKQERYTACPILKMRVNGASTISGLASWVIWVAIGCRHSYRRYRPPLYAKKTVTCSLPDSEN